MDKELEWYKKEIERRFSKSDMKDYVYPRGTIQTTITDSTIETKLAPHQHISVLQSESTLMM